MRTGGPYFIGVDGGTESLRAGIFESAGTPLAFASSPYPTHYPRPSWAEQSPSDWWQALGVAVKAAVAEAGIGVDDVASICLDTTCCTVVALDEGGQALRPALLWMDMRSAAQAARVVEGAAGDPALAVNGAGRGPVSAEWMVPKALWLLEQEPLVFHQATFICEYQDYMNFHLTGRMCASRNNATVRWHHGVGEGEGGHVNGGGPPAPPTSLLQRLGLSSLLKKWPRDIIPPGGVVGGLTREAAAHVGLAEGTLVAQGGADAFIGMIGLGVLRPGQLALLTGSSHLHLGMTDRPLHGAGIWGSYPEAVVAGLGVVEGGQTSTGSIINWLKRRLLQDSLSYEQLNEAAEKLPPGAEGLLCLDHFQGNRTPYTDPLSRGVIAGLTLAHTPAHIFRALLEAVAFGTHLILETMGGRGYKPTSITVAGGAAKSPLWLQIHADVCGLPLRLTEVGEAPALGCAILGAAASGRFPSIEAAAEAMVHLQTTVLPDPHRHALYRRHYEAYKRLYHSTAPILHSLAAPGKDHEVVDGEETATLPEVGDENSTFQQLPAPPDTDTAGIDGKLSSWPQLIISPSILAADFTRLGAEVEGAVAGGAAWVHVDIMDGHFVDNLTMGAPVVKSLRRHTNAFLDCHLSVTHPQNYIAPLAEAGASQLTFHWEVVADVEAARQLALQIRGAGMRVGVALRPGTGVEGVWPLIEDGTVDMVLIMSVEPGFGGQAFQPQVLDQVRKLRGSFPSLDIQVDGGIKLDTARLAVGAGANVLVTGTWVFQNRELSPAAAVRKLLEGAAADDER